VSDLDELRRLAAPGMSLPVHVVVDNGPDSWGVRLCIPDGSTVAHFGAGQKADAEYVAALLNLAATSDPAPLDAAWAEAEAALPPGHGLWLWHHGEGYVADCARSSKDEYLARALGTTPAAALQALAATLRDTTGREPSAS
jgi:hypothetical protein